MNIDYKIPKSVPIDDRVPKTSFDPSFILKI